MTRVVECACRHCHRPFTLYVSQVARGRGQFCSRRCAVRFSGGKPKVAKTCEICQSEFLVGASVAAKGHGRFCSDVCRCAGAKLRARSAHLRACNSCGEDFIVRRRRRAIRRYCSHRCFAASRQGAGSPTWKGGVSLDAGYVSAKAEERRLRLATAALAGGVSPEQWRMVRERFGFACAWCRTPEVIQAVTMDHIVPIVLGGGHCANNIQPLCGSCNSKKSTRTIAFFPEGSALEITDMTAVLSAVLDGTLPLDTVRINTTFVGAMR